MTIEYGVAPCVKINIVFIALFQVSRMSDYLH